MDHQKCSSNSKRAGKKKQGQKAEGTNRKQTIKWYALSISIITLNVNV